MQDNLDIRVFLTLQIGDGVLILLVAFRQASPGIRSIQRQCQEDPLVGARGPRDRQSRGQAVLIREAAEGSIGK